jgi:hypothetical protein
MKMLFIRIIAFIKGLVLLVKPHIFLGFMKTPFLFISNVLSLTKWISQQDTKNILNDFYSPKRDFSKRYKLYHYVLERYDLKNEPINYLEFGVCGGESFKWWVEANTNSHSNFYGFDTFEGLPRNWGVVFKKGNMSANVPDINDTRVEFVKGLFQETLIPFLNIHNLGGNKRMVVHLDADLFSSTLFSLASLAPYLKIGDILLFDEFSVPNHEFHAFKCFTESFYIKTKLIGAVNNYFRVAFQITD